MKTAERSIESRVKSARERLERLRDLYELGHLTRDQYAARREKVQTELLELQQAVLVSPVAAAGEQIRSLADDWPRMDAAAMREVLETIFTDVQLEDGALVSATPRPGWLAYRDTALSAVCVGRGWWESNPRRPP